jgi:hypothetical protein
LSGLGEGDVMMGLSFVGQFRFFSVCAGEEGVVYLFLPVGSAFALSLVCPSSLSTPVQSPPPSQQQRRGQKEACIWYFLVPD